MLSVSASSEQDASPHNDELVVEKGSIRALQAAPSPSQNIGKVAVKRFDFVDASEWKLIEGCAMFFQVISWCAIIATIVLSCFGSSVITQEFSLLLQIVFLHVYVAT